MTNSSLTIESGFREGESRTRSTLFSESLDDWVEKDNAVRVGLHEPNLLITIVKKLSPTQCEIDMALGGDSINDLAIRPYCGSVVIYM